MKLSKNKLKKAERRVANHLKKEGFFNIKRSKGSRGLYDIYARNPKGEKTYIQVKSGSAFCTNREKIELTKLAKERNGKAYCMHYEKGKIDVIKL